jgi:hypothetical protein
MVQPLVLVCWGEYGRLVQVGSVALYTCVYVNTRRDELHSSVAQWQMKHENTEDEEVRRERDRQCTNYVTLQRVRVRATIDTVGKQNILHILSVCL